MKKEDPPYRPARGSEAIVCWFLIAGCVAVGILAVNSWLANPAVGFPFLETLLPMLVILGGVLRLRGLAPPPKGI